MDILRSGSSFWDAETANALKILTLITGRAVTIVYAAGAALIEPRVGVIDQAGQGRTLDVLAPSAHAGLARLTALIILTGRWIKKLFRAAIAGEGDADLRATRIGLTRMPSRAISHGSTEADAVPSATLIGLQAALTETRGALTRALLRLLTRDEPLDEGGADAAHPPHC